MKRLALLMMAIMAFAVVTSVSPVFSGVHPCEASFGVKIEGKFGYLGDMLLGVTLKEPTYGFCSEFTVEVWALGVEDMYAYEFTLNWDDTEHIHLVNYEPNTDYWADAFVVLPDTDYMITWIVLDNDLTYYTQVAAAIAPSTGFTGDALLATLTFHIFNDVCWRDDYYPSLVINFELDEMKMSDSCSTDITICNNLDNKVNFKPVQPKVFIEPNYESNCELPGKFTKTVWVANITKMHDMCFDLYWNYLGYIGGWKEVKVDDDLIGATKRAILIERGYVLKGHWWYAPVWPQIKVEDFTILIEEPIFDYTFTFDDSVETATIDGYGMIHFCFELKETATLMNGTFPIIEILFEKQDPWFCGRQPDYYFEQPHEWFTKACYSDFWFENGYISVMCPEEANIWFGINEGDTTGVINHALYWDYDQGIYMDFTSNMYIFRGVPGDLNLDGIVDITDILIIASFYGAAAPWDFWDDYPAMYFDLNEDGLVDIFDIVIVTKNFGRTCA